MISKVSEFTQGVKLKDLENKGHIVPCFVELCDGEFKMAKNVLRAINHPLRHKILDIIEDENGINVTNLYVKLRLEQSVASQHLAILKEYGFLHTKRDGKFIYYYINKDKISHFSAMIKEIESRK